MAETRKQRKRRESEDFLDGVRDGLGLPTHATSNNGRACNRKVEKRKRKQRAKETKHDH